MTTIKAAIEEWHGKRRQMGCVSATAWFCKRVPGFYPPRRRSYLPGGTDRNGRFWEHAVATDGKIIVDLAPSAEVLISQGL